MTAILKPTLQEINQLTRKPFPASTKNFQVGSRPDIRVPVRDIALTNGKSASVYDTSGPYTDPTIAIDVRTGLPAMRAASRDSGAPTRISSRQRTLA